MHATRLEKFARITSSQVIAGSPRSHANRFIFPKSRWNHVASHDHDHDPPVGRGQSQSYLTAGLTRFNSPHSYLVRFYRPATRQDIARGDVRARGNAPAIRPVNPSQEISGKPIHRYSNFVVSFIEENRNARVRLSSGKDSRTPIYPRRSRRTCIVVRQNGCNLLQREALALHPPPLPLYLAYISLTSRPRSNNSADSADVAAPSREYPARARAVA